LDVFPNLRLIHLVRDPLKVAASAAWRELWRRRLRVPFHFYAGDDGKRHFVWALTGNEDIFRLFDGAPLTLFQWYLLQWIEIENRAMAFLNDFQLHGRCFTLRVPEDLDNADILRRMFGFFGLPVRRPQILLARRKNRSFGYISAPPIGLERQRGHILERLPSPYLQIFRREPYASLPWSRPLRESAAPPIPAAKAGD
ncbi:MAG: hypothetical protein KGR98_08355, partial [Verrucomicrobia bacterium]|nr:hypothetical protein [Verrucomicrobiota bacterium]